jgi:hypothetical protein
LQVKPNFRHPQASYRDLLARVRANLAEGRIVKETRDELEGLADVIGRRLAPKQRAEMNLKYSIPLSPGAIVAAVATGNVAGVLPEARPEGEVPLDAVRDGLALNNPRRPYRKLLTRLITEEANYRAIDRSLKNLWASA